MAAPQKTNRAQSDDVRQRLLTCGIELVQKHGFHATGIKDLIAAAKIPKGSFYYYFPSKEIFVAEMVERYIQPYIEKIEALNTQRDVPAYQLLCKYYDREIAEFDANPDTGGCLLGNLLGEIGDTSEHALHALSNAVYQYKSALAGMLQRAQDEGDVRNDLSSDELAGMLFDAWQGAILRMRVETTTAPLRAFSDQILKVVIPSPDHH